MVETRDKIVSVGKLKFPTWDSPDFRRRRRSIYFADTDSALSNLVYGERVNPPG